MEKRKTYINEDGSMDFDKFNLLSKNEQKNEMKGWSEQQWVVYMSQEPIVSTEEIYNHALEVINKSDIE